MVKKGKKFGKVTGTDTATYPFWAINVSAMEIYPHDVHGRQTGPSEKVKDIQEAFDICEERNYPGRKR